MNLKHLKERLEYISNTDSNIKESINLFISEVEEEIKVSDVMTDTLASIMDTLEEFNVSFLSLVNTFRGIDTRDIDSKTQVAQEIMCILSGMHTYLMDIISRYSTKTSTNAELYKYIKVLIEKKEACVSDKYAWGNVIKALTTTKSYKVELLRYKTAMKDS